MILNALEGKSLPVYGNGLQVRDWLFVKIIFIFPLFGCLKGQIGETYNIGRAQ